MPIKPLGKLFRNQKKQIAQKILSWLDTNNFSKIIVKGRGLTNISYTWGWKFDLASQRMACLCMQRVWLGSRLDLARHKIASLASFYINVAVTLSKEYWTQLSKTSKGSACLSHCYQTFFNNSFRCQYARRHLSILFIAVILHNYFLIDRTIDLVTSDKMIKWAIIWGWVGTLVANGDHGIFCPQSKDLDIVDDDVADNMMEIEHKIG